MCVCVCLFVSYRCVNGVGPGSVCVRLFPGLCGGVAQILLSGRHLKLLSFSSWIDPYHLSMVNNLHFVTVIVHFMIFCWESTYYLLHVCLFWQRAPFTVAHPVFPVLILNRIKGLGKKLLYAVQIVKPLEAKCDCDPKTPKCTSKISLGKIPNPKLLHQCVNEWLSIQ